MYVLYWVSDFNKGHFHVSRQTEAEYADGEGCQNSCSACEWLVPGTVNPED